MRKIPFIFMLLISLYSYSYDKQEQQVIKNRIDDLDVKGYTIEDIIANENEISKQLSSLENGKILKLFDRFNNIPKNQRFMIRNLKRNLIDDCVLHKKIENEYAKQYQIFKQCDIKSIEKTLDLIPMIKDSLMNTYIHYSREDSYFDKDKDRFVYKNVYQNNLKTFERRSIEGALQEIANASDGYIREIKSFLYDKDDWREWVLSNHKTMLDTDSPIISKINPMGFLFAFESIHILEKINDYYIAFWSSNWGGNATFDHYSLFKYLEDEDIIDETSRFNTGYDIDKDYLHTLGNYSQNLKYANKDEHLKHEKLSNNISSLMDKLDIDFCYSKYGEYLPHRLLKYKLDALHTPIDEGLFIILKSCGLNLSFWDIALKYMETKQSPNHYFIDMPLYKFEIKDEDMQKVIDEYKKTDEYARYIKELEEAKKNAENQANSIHDDNKLISPENRTVSGEHL